MHFEGEYRIKAPQERIYSVLVEPQRVVRYMPFLEVLDLKAIDKDTVQGRVKTGVSFLKGTFTVEAKIVERVPHRHARMKVRSHGMGSTFDIEMSMDLAAEGAETRVRWTADAAIRGTVASIGARLLPGLVEGKTKDFLEALRVELEGGARPSVGHKAKRR